MKFVKVPRIFNPKLLELGDRFIYAVIRKVAYSIKSDTSQFPKTWTWIKHSTLLERVECDEPRLLDSIKRLKRVGLFTIKEKSPGSNIYVFDHSDDKVDLFSEEFLMNPNFSFEEKDFWMQLQRFVWIDRSERVATLKTYGQWLFKQLDLDEETFKKYLNVFINAKVLIPANDDFLVDFDPINQSWLYGKKD